MLPLDTRVVETERPLYTIPKWKIELLIWIETKQKTKGVLTQTLGPSMHPVTYLSKQLDPVATGWLTCQRAVTANASLMKEIKQVNSGSRLYTHSIRTLAV